MILITRSLENSITTPPPSLPSARPGRAPSRSGRQGRSRRDCSLARARSIRGAPRARPGPDRRRRVARSSTRSRRGRPNASRATSVRSFRTGGSSSASFAAALSMPKRRTRSSPSTRNGLGQARLRPRDPAPRFQEIVETGDRVGGRGGRRRGRRALGPDRHQGEDARAARVGPGRRGGGRRGRRARPPRKARPRSTSSAEARRASGRASGGRSPPRRSSARARPTRSPGKRREGDSRTASRGTRAVRRFWSASGRSARAPAASIRRRRRSDRNSLPTRRGSSPASRSLPSVAIAAPRSPEAAAEKTPSRSSRSTSARISEQTRLVHRSSRERGRLVEEREPVPQAPVRGGGEHPERPRSHADLLLRGDLLELLGDLRDRERPESEALAARHDRRAESCAARSRPG